eukprot:TRINITY_DN4195_c0_g1_i2.p3 TRINITY_DN4195_c0_g1~~TRINITY_DN4195_c0_g1_i2.p3  ORF type:complete len:128 (+),score=32.00 TRINITY_DN4195_c0_g1_i2:34-384(+)
MHQTAPAAALTLMPPPPAFSPSCGPTPPPPPTPALRPSRVPGGYPLLPAAALLFDQPTDSPYEFALVGDGGGADCANRHNRAAPHRPSNSDRDNRRNAQTRHPNATSRLFRSSPSC